jgi:hypothetical protein
MSMRLSDVAMLQGAAPRCPSTVAVGGEEKQTCGLLLFPFACALLGFRNLSGSHAGSDVVTRLYCSVMGFFSGGVCGSKVKPFVGLYVVLGDTFSPFVYGAEEELRDGIPLSGSKVKPFVGLYVVLRDAASLIVHEAEA